MAGAVKLAVKLACSMPWEQRHTRRQLSAAAHQQLLCRPINLPDLSSSLLLQHNAAPICLQQVTCLYYDPHTQQVSGVIVGFGAGLAQQLLAQ